MKVMELLEDKSADDLSLTLSAAINQIASRVIDTGADKPVSLKAIINILNKMGIYITEKQFREMSNVPPLSNVVANVAGDSVTFIGQSTTSTPAVKPDQSTATLEKMAKRAANKRED